jgi:hypothetical protein
MIVHQYRPVNEPFRRPFSLVVKMRLVKTSLPAVATRVVVSIQADADEDLVRGALAGGVRADIVELRIDGIDRPNLERLRDVGPRLGKPLLLTCRSARAGGAFSGAESDRLAILERAIALGFDYVDIEIDALSDPLPRAEERSSFSSPRLPIVPAGRRPEDRAARARSRRGEIAARVSVARRGDSTWRAGDKAREAGKSYVPVPLDPRNERAHPREPARRRFTTLPSQLRRRRAGADLRRRFPRPLSLPEHRQ